VCLCRRCHEIFHGKTTHTVVHNHVVTNVTQPAVDPIDKIKEQIDDVILDMPDYEGDVKLTNIMIMRTKTKRGGWTKATFRALGLPDKPKHGWRKKLLGTVIPRQDYRLALLGRYKYS